MKTLTIYKKDNCTNCAQQRALVQRYAKDNNMELVVKRTPLNPDWQAEASKYRKAQPFVVMDGKAKSLSKFLEEIAIEYTDAETKK